jgi:hypothetical protein
MITTPFPAAWRPLGWLILVCLAAGCSTSRDLQSLELQTRITPGDLKLFELAFPAQAHPVSLSTNERNRQRRPDTSDRQMQKHMLKMLDEVMEQTSYCREGYVLLGRYAGETTRRVRGECRDRATDEDRHRFPDTVERW